jgi:indolepyruvate ferredoxin oxidoreductase alpha subunit
LEGGLILSKLGIGEKAGKKVFMLGNEAIARGALEAGVQVAAAYPGTPSTEVTEDLAEVAKELNFYVEWSVNEKVALEVAFGASAAGLRSLASMKHVGLNVAHDPLMSTSYIGARGGFVILVADDPSCWSSQNEQDTRFVAEQAYLPVLEPSSAAEAKEMMIKAFELSEQFHHPFILRSVTRVGHARSDITLGELPKKRNTAGFTKDPATYVLTPAAARRNRVLVVKRMEQIKQAVNTMPFNELRLVGNAKLGVIASGLAYSYTIEALKWLKLENKVSVLKIVTNPLPEELVKKLLSSVKEAVVVEELEPFVENHVKVIAQENGINVKIHGKDVISIIGELSTTPVTKALAKLTHKDVPINFAAIEEQSKAAEKLLPTRPPALCPGCPHRASHYIIKTAAQRVAREMGVEPIYPSDIGCYTLGVNPPLNSVDAVICMGASISFGSGLAHSVKAPIIATIGDSTFFHSGMPPLVNAVYNNARVTMVIVDNSATAMTGFQSHPGTGKTAMGDPSISIKPEDIAKACGVKFIEFIDPFDVKASIDTMEKAIRFEGPSVVISRQLCAMVDQKERKQRGEKFTPLRVNPEKCNSKCQTCIKLLGCPALSRANNKTVIDASQCTGCRVCAQICPYNAIEE